MQENELEISKSYAAFRVQAEIEHFLTLLSETSNKDKALVEILSQANSMLDIIYFTEKNDG